MNGISSRFQRQDATVARACLTPGALPWRRVALISLLCVWQLGLPPAMAASKRPSKEAGLVDVYRNALANNAQYHAALAHYRAVIEAKPQARSRLLPDLRAVASYDEVDQSVKGEIITGADIDRSESFHRSRYGITLTQPLYNRKALIGLDKADIAVQQARLGLMAARGELAMQAARSYFALVDAHNSLKFVRAEKRAIHEQLEQIRGRVEAGLVTVADLRAAQAQYDLAAADEISAENAIEIARIQLKTLTGQSYERAQTLPQSAQLPPLTPSNAQPWIDAALQYNTALRSQRSEVRMASLGIDSAKAARWPQLDLKASYSYYDQSGGIFQEDGLAGANEGETASVGVTLSVPIFNGGLISSQVREAVASHDEEMALTQQQRVETVAGTRTAVLNIRKDKARIKALAKAIESAAAAVHAMAVGYDVGTSTSADLLSALRDLYRARRDYALSRSQYLLDLLTLKQLAGQLDKKALAVIDRRLQ